MALREVVLAQAIGLALMSIPGDDILCYQQLTELTEPVHTLQCTATATVPHVDKSLSICSHSNVWSCAGVLISVHSQYST